MRVSSPPKATRLKPPRRADSHRARFGRAQVDVFHAFRGFAWQARSIEIFDVVILSIEKIQHLYGDFDLWLLEPVADPQAIRPTRR